MYTTAAPKFTDYLSIFAVGTGCLLLIYYELYRKPQNKNEQD